MKSAFVLLCLAVAVIAHKHHHHKGEGYNKDKGKPMNGVGFVPFYPFPHMDELALYKFEHLTLLPGSAFTACVDKFCARVRFGEEKGGACPLNMTTAAKILATPCAPEVANVTCVESRHLGQYNATTNMGYPQPEGEHHHHHHHEHEQKHGHENHHHHHHYPHGGPLCHVEAMGVKFQPCKFASIFVLTPKIQTCFFSVAPPPTSPVPTGTAYPDPTGTPGPEPTGQPVPVDPPCHFV